MQCLLNDELLDYQVAFAPLLNQVSDESATIVIDASCGGTHSFFNDFEYEFGRADALRLGLALPDTGLWEQLGGHVLIYEVFEVQNRDGLLLHHKFESCRICINEPVFRVLMLR